MKISLDLDYNSALFIRACISKHLDADYSTDMITALDDAIANEEERRGVEHAEQLMETGGTDDSQYRRDMKDAGRSHLTR